MLDLDKKAEEEAIALYKQTVEAARDEKDYATMLLFEEILKEEEDHHYKFSTLLEKEWLT